MQSFSPAGTRGFQAYKRTFSRCSMICSNERPPSLKQDQEKISGFMWVYVGLCGLRRNAGQQDHAPTGVTDHKTTRRNSPPAVDFNGSRVVGFWPSGCRTTSSTEKKGSTKDSIEGMPRG